MDNLQKQYRGVTVTYDENSDRWQFEIDGRERFAETLSNAKKAIDSPERKKTKKFKPVEAFLCPRIGIPRKVTVTAMAADTRYGGQGFWITDEQKQRSKVSAANLFAYNAGNIQRFEDAALIRDQIEGLEEEMAKIESKLQPFFTSKDLRSIIHPQQ